jgi:broad specificity phosphatase PhoE
MSDFYMIRHGQASFGEEDYDRLSPIGVVQAGIVARQWVSIGRKIDAIYVGSMKRQADTAEALVCAYEDKQMLVPEIIIDAAFDEYDSGSVFEAQLPGMIEKDPAISEKLPDIFSNRRVFQLLFQEAMYRWVSGDHDILGVTTWCDFKQRVQDGMQGVMQTQGAKKTVAVFTSGGPISVVVQEALGLTDQMAMAQSWQVMNASVTWFKYNAKGIALAGFNDVAHLELENDKALLTYR